RQTQGRGRLGRVWESPEGGIYCSLIVRPSLGTPPAGGVGEGVPEPQAEGRPRRSVRDIPQLSLLMGLSAAEAIRESAMVSPRVRWPNDLLIGAQKIAGILTEARDGAVVIGIGINVSTAPTDLPDTATSLAAAGGENLDLFHLTARLYRRFFRWYDLWSGEGFPPVHEALRPHMGLFGEIVHIRAGSEEFEGTATDLDESGRLLVRLDSGILKPFDVGEVTLLR
ncbi:MAG: biotin--[acetyl-CoA-carboxylase] ligase, partial [Candidatus Omnitrophota bacterium]|nr:biotin--[acetyl-CoA-carboxylase] ligase [Candidatus Omnitrophota bacterium]